MNTNTIGGDRAALVKAIENAVSNAPRNSRGYAFMSAHGVGDSVAEIEREIEREELIIKLFESDAVRQVFERFGGKVVNKRLWSALDEACYTVAPAGEPFKRYDGATVKPARAYIVDGTRFGSPHFARVIVRNDSNDEMIYGRIADWMTCPEEQKTEYYITTGERLDAARALAVLDYEAKRRREGVAAIRAGLAKAPEQIAEYLRAVAAVEKVVEAFDWSIRQAFEIGERRTLPVCIHG